MTYLSQSASASWHSAAPASPRPPGRPPAGSSPAQTTERRSSCALAAAVPLGELQSGAALVPAGQDRQSIDQSAKLHYKLILRPCMHRMPRSLPSGWCVQASRLKAPATGPICELNMNSATRPTACISLGQLCYWKTPHPRRLPEQVQHRLVDHSLRFEASADTAAADADKHGTCSASLMYGVSEVLGLKIC